MKIWSLMFQCLFYTGSWVKESTYQPLLEKIGNHPYVDNVSIKKPFDNALCGSKNNSIVLIGHSLGGYFALRDAMRHPNKVVGIVLLNSHFNSRGVMPYPKIPIHKVQAPTLTILGGNDKRLPIRKAMDDAWECQQEKELDKYFIVNKGHDHFTGVATTYGQKQVIDPIYEFLYAMSSRNFSRVVKMEKYNQRFRSWMYYLSERSVVMSQSVNLIDAILRLASPRYIWKWTHFLWFLSTKPDPSLGFMYVDDDYIYLKGTEQDEGQYKILLKEWMRDVPTKVVDVGLPTIHPSIIAWLMCPIQPKYKDGVMEAPRMVLRVNNQTTYYKVPSPRRFYSRLPEYSFFDF